MALASEDDFLALIQSSFPASNGHVRLGRGDDCAVLNFSSTACMSMDLFLEDVHFRRSYFEPGDIGYKSLAVNVSDIYGMGARPLGFCMGLSGPLHFDEVYWSKLLQGMSSFAQESQVVLVGGDLSQSDKLGVCITVWGEAHPQGRFMERGHTRLDDVLFVVGPVGLARAGLNALEAGAAQGDENGKQARIAFPEAVRAHLRPRLHPEAAGSLARLDCVRGLMDVSDGLVRDVPRFLALGQGVDFSLTPENIAPDVLAYCSASENDPVEFALLGGEDYALLGACSPSEWATVARAVPEAICVGRVTETPGVRVAGASLGVSGFDHFGVQRK